MRFALASLIVAVIPSAHAATKQAQCKKRCDSNYQYCMNRAVAKQAKKSCKTDHKSCRVTCQPDKVNH